jgi:hypothetical protein
MRWPLLLLIVAGGCTRDTPRATATVARAADSALTSRSGAEPPISANATDSATRPEFRIPDDSLPLPPAPESEPVRFDAAGRPIMPIVQHGACEGESCEGGFVAYACLATDVQRGPAQDEPIIARIPEGQFVQVRRDLIVRSPGVVVVKKDFQLDWDEAENERVPRADTVQFARGDTLYVLNYLELGRWTWAFRGRLYDSGEFWTDIDPATARTRNESAYATMHSEPAREDWWKVTQRDGSTGWWLHNRNRDELQTALQSVSGMQKWGDDCAQVKARAAK